MLVVSNSQVGVLAHHGLVGARDAMRLAGITYRQLDHWTRLGLVRCSTSVSSGYARGYEPREVEILTALAAATNVGVVVSGQLGQAVVAHVRERGLLGSVTCGAVTVDLDGMRDNGDPLT